MTLSIHRKKTRQISVGNVKVGGTSPISVQSMTNTVTRDVESTIAQIRRLEEAGCEMIRVAVPDEESSTALTHIKRHISIPLIADIHFDYLLAVTSMIAGADGIRINPGNIGSREKCAVTARYAPIGASDKPIPSIRWQNGVKRFV